MTSGSQRKALPTGIQEPTNGVSAPDHGLILSITMAFSRSLSFVVGISVLPCQNGNLSRRAFWRFCAQNVWPERPMSTSQRRHCNAVTTTSFSSMPKSLASFARLLTACPLKMKCRSVSAFLFVVLRATSLRICAHREERSHHIECTDDSQVPRRSQGYSSYSYCSASMGSILAAFQAG